MTTILRAIPDFILANPLYAGAVVTFFTIDVSGHITATKAALYADPVSGVTTNNPQVLDGNGKFAAPVYIAAPVIASIVGPNVASHVTGVIDARGTWRGPWTTETIYFSTDFIADPVSGNIYAAAADYTSSALISTDISNGNLVLVINQTAIVFVQIDFVIDGGGVVIDQTQFLDRTIPFNMNITQVTLLADQVGTVTLDLLKSSYAGFPPVTSICAAALPTIVAGQQKSQDAVLTGWSKVLSAGDILRCKVSNVQTIRRVTLSLLATRS